MPVTWVRMRHTKHHGETDVPTGAVRRYRARGWRPVEELNKKARRGQAAGSQPSDQSSEQREQQREET